MSSTAAGRRMTAIGREATAATNQGVVGTGSAVVLHLVWGVSGHVAAVVLVMVQRLG